MLHFTLILICVLAKRTELKKSHDLKQDFMKVLNISSSTRGFYELSFKENRFHMTFQPTSKIHFRGGIPERFDARERWPNCTTIDEFYDTGKCLSSVGQIIVTVLSDRTCVKTNEEDFVYSLEDFLTCCEQCNKMIPPERSICSDLNYFIAGFKHWLSVGIVSGDSDSEQGCKPYSEEFALEPEKNMKCNPTCTNSDHPVPYEKDRKKGRSLRVIISKNRDDIKNEIFNYGPVVTFFAVPEDFLYHEEGVYERQFGGIIGYFPVKIIGWGTENSSDNFFWLIFFPRILDDVDMYGTFKISSNLHLEDMIFAPHIYEHTHRSTTQATTSSSTKQFIDKLTIASDLLVVFLLLST